MEQTDDFKQTFRDRSSLAMTMRQTSPLSYAWTVALATLLMVGEIVIHGFIIPLMGAYFGSLLLNTFIPGSSAFWEIIVTILTVLVLMRLGIYFASFEGPFFKQYFILDKGYDCVILIREGVNVVILFIHLGFLFRCVQNIARDGALKETLLGEKVADLTYHYIAKCEMYISEAFRNFSEYEIVKEEPSSCHSSWFSWMSWCFWWSPEDPVKAEEDFLESKDGHAAELLLAIALITSSIIKMIYLTVLSTYLRSVDIIVKLNLNCTVAEDDEEDTETPTEDDAEESEDEESRNTNLHSNASKQKKPMTSTNKVRKHSSRRHYLLRSDIQEIRKPRLTKT